MEHLRSLSAGNRALQIKKIDAGCHATLRSIITLDLCVAIKDRCKLFTRNRIIRTKFLAVRVSHNTVLLCPGYRIVNPYGTGTVLNIRKVVLSLNGRAARHTVEDHRDLARVILVFGAKVVALIPDINPFS